MILKQSKGRGNFLSLYPWWYSSHYSQEQLGSQFKIQVNFAQHITPKFLLTNSLVVSLRKKSGAGGMIRWVKKESLAAKIKDLSSIPRTHKTESKDWHLDVVLWSPQSYCSNAPLPIQFLYLFCFLEREKSVFGNNRNPTAASAQISCAHLSVLC